MRDHRPTQSIQLLSDSQFKRIQDHASMIVQINQTLQEILPNALAIHCRAANIRQGLLLIDVASAAIKMKLNYEKITILNKLRNQGFANLMGIDIRINPELYRETQKKPTIRQRAPLSESAAQSLMVIADIAPPKIKERLARIAALAHKKYPNEP